MNLKAERPAPAPAHGGADVSDDRFSGIEEMRAWLARRRLEREHGVIQAIQRVLPNTSLAVRPPAAPEEDGGRQLLTPLGQRYAQGFQSRRPLPTMPLPRPYGGGGPETRDARYLFNGAGSQSRPATPLRSDPAARSGWTPTPGSGFIASDSKLYRIGRSLAPERPAAAPASDDED